MAGREADTICDLIITLSKGNYYDILCRSFFLKCFYLSSIFLIYKKLFHFNIYFPYFLFFIMIGAVLAKTALATQQLAAWLLPVGARSSGLSAVITSRVNTRLYQPMMLAVLWLFFLQRHHEVLCENSEQLLSNRSIDYHEI